MSIEERENKFIKMCSIYKYDFPKYVHDGFVEKYTRVYAGQMLFESYNSFDVRARLKRYEKDIKYK